MTKKQKTLSIGLAVVLVLSVVAVTYAYFTASITNNSTAVSVTTTQLANLTMTSIKSDATPPIYPGWVGYQAIEVKATGSGVAVYDLTLNISADAGISDDILVSICKVEDSATALAAGDITFTAANAQVNTTVSPVQYYMSGGSVTLPTTVCTSVVSGVTLTSLGSSKLISTAGGKTLTRTTADVYDKYYISYTYQNANYTQTQGQTFVVTPDVSLKAEVIDFTNKEPGLYDTNGHQTYTWQELINNESIHVYENSLIGGFGNEFTGVLVIPYGITEIYNEYDAESGDGTSFGNIISVIIPNSVTIIGDRAFAERTSLTSITIPSSVTSIGVEAFAGCTGLASITIPSSVTSIGSGAFENCASLTSITIPSSVTSIGEWAFWNCISLESITVDSNNTVYDSRNNSNAIIETATNTLIQGCNNTVIPNSVTSIGSGAFENCAGLTSITIPSSVTSIGSSAFEKCTGLTSITIPSSVTSIGTYAFFYDEGLTSITIPSSVTSIGNSAFDECDSLSTVNYTGTEQQWNGINIGYYNNPLINANRVYNFVG